MSRKMLRHRLEQQAARLLGRGPDDLPEYQRLWVCQAYAQAKLMDAEDVHDVDTACDFTSDGETGELAVLVAVCELLKIEIPADYTG